MKLLINLEELAKLAFSYFVSLYLGFSWWAFFALLFLPDISIIGYIINTKVGAWCYNLFHHQGTAILTGVTGIILGLPELQLAGLVLFGHSALDRALGYGLKYNDNFKHTHLGWIGAKPVK